MAHGKYMDGDEVERRVRKGAAFGINAVMTAVKGKAQDYAPVDEGTLRDSAVGPDDTHSDIGIPHHALPHHLEAMVSFNTVYAAAQEVGEMTYLRNGKAVTWQVRNHPRGGRTHYLSDAFKAIIGRGQHERIIRKAVEASLKGKL